MSNYVPSINEIPATLRIRVNQQPSENPPTNNANSYMHEPLLSDKEVQDTQNDVHMQVESTIKPGLFSNIIPYAQQIYTDETMASKYPFLSEYGMLYYKSFFI